MPKLLEDVMTRSYQKMPIRRLQRSLPTLLEPFGFILSDNRRCKFRYDLLS